MNRIADERPVKQLREKKVPRQEEVLEFTLQRLQSSMGMRSKEGEMRAKNQVAYGILMPSERVA